MVRKFIAQFILLAAVLFLLLLLGGPRIGSRGVVCLIIGGYCCICDVAVLGIPEMSSCECRVPVMAIRTNHSKISTM